MTNWLTSPGALQAIRSERGKRDFERWLWQVNPDWSWGWAHLVLIRQYLDNITRGQTRRLILEVPPRHGKSEMVTVRYPVWRLKRDPSLNVIIGAYNQTLANRFSRKARRIAEVELELRGDRAAVEEWETEGGGGLRAVGVGAGVTGHGGDLIVVDDPVKNREEANSETYREKVWEWWRDDLYTRLEPGGAMIIIMTRWHEDDLAGRILASEFGDEFAEVKLPAFAEEDDPMGRQPGAALCPERFDEEALERIREVLGLSFYALYQQHPQPAEGGMFKRGKAAIVDVVPVDARRVRYWDKAGTAGGGAYTAGVLLARTDDGLIYVEDVQRGQWAAPEREAVIRQTAELDAARYGSRSTVNVWVEQEPGSSGKDSVNATIRNLAGFVVYADKVTGDKVTRAEPWAAQWEAGNVRLVRAKWNGSFIDEHTAFPTGAYKDQVDAAAAGFSKLAEDGLSMAW